MARVFNGTSDLISANAAATWANNVAFSVSLWINAPLAATEKCAYSEGRTSSTVGALEIYNQSASTGKLGLRMASKTTSNILSIASTAKPFDGSWHHVLHTQDSAGNYILYIDGASDHSGSYVTTNPPICNTVGIGVFARSTNTLFYSGKIAEVAKWSRTLSAAEALQLTLGVPASHLVPDHYWALAGVASPEPDTGTVTPTDGTLTGTTSVAGPPIVGLPTFYSSLASRRPVPMIVGPDKDKILSMRGRYY